MSDPRISPMTNSDELTIVTAEMAVKNSGKDVTAASRTPPKKAPLILVFFVKQVNKICKFA